MRVKRIVANIAASDPALARAFYGDLFGLELGMDRGWIRTYVGDALAPVQLSVMSEGGSGTAVPDLSIEVDDLSEILARLRAAGIEPIYGPVDESWGVRRFFVRDPFGRIVNVLAHR